VSKTQVVLKSDIPAIQRALPSRVSEVVRKAAYDVAAVSATNTPVDTGNLKNSLFVEMEDERNAVVGYTAEYAHYVELGHHTRAGRYIPGRYMLTGAVNKVAPAFLAAIKGLATKG
jgi:hypothetical protein